jgi:hypothetical protein
MTLTAPRDAILPKPICWEIGVRDADRFVNERGL